MAARPPRDPLLARYQPAPSACSSSAGSPAARARGTHDIDDGELALREHPECAAIVLAAAQGQQPGHRCARSCKAAVGVHARGPRHFLHPALRQDSLGRSVQPSLASSASTRSHVGRGRAPAAMRRRHAGAPIEASSARPAPMGRHSRSSTKCSYACCVARSRISGRQLRIGRRFVVEAARLVSQLEAQRGVWRSRCLTTCAHPWRWRTPAGACRSCQGERCGSRSMSPPSRGRWSLRAAGASVTLAAWLVVPFARYCATGTSSDDVAVAERQAQRHRSHRTRNDAGGQQRVFVVGAEIARHHQLVVAHD